MKFRVEQEEENKKRTNEIENEKHQKVFQKEEDKKTTDDIELEKGIKRV